YKAIDQMLGVPVALKVMNRNAVESETAKERLKREIILARKVAHPNVSRIYDIGEHRGVPYVSMEYVKGESVASMLKQLPQIPAQEALLIFRQVLLALYEAHRAGVIHRDLKPKNIMVNSEGKAWIMDFGLSISHDVSRVTKAGMLIG